MKVNAKSILAVAGLSCLLDLPLPPSVAAHGKHHPRATRVDQVRRHGDAKMTKRVAGHVVKEAILRYQLQGAVSKEDVERAKKEMYTFLKWKLGGPAPVAGQYISTGYKHFENGYTDEAGGILLGVISFANVQPELVMPKWMQESLRKQAGASGPAIALALQAYGVPMPLAQILGSKIAEVLTKGLLRNVAGFIPKSYDVDNRLVQAAVKARKEAGLKPTQPVGEVADEDEDEPSSPPPQPIAQPSQPAADPCCDITSIGENGLVTVRDTATNSVFQLQVDDKRLLLKLRIGSRISADFGTQKVSVDSGQPAAETMLQPGHTPPDGAKLPAVKMPTVMGIQPCCSVVANPAMKGRLGRLLVAFPEGANAEGTYTSVYKEQDKIADFKGNNTVELLPGAYAVTISGKRVEGVTIRSGHDTKVRVGMLRVAAGKDTYVKLLNADKTLKLADGKGNFELGLPIGAVNVSIAGQAESVTIEEGKITDF